jgi:drug/metabolite transporter (DMT)-like permease
MRRIQLHPFVLALAAALSFGASAPLAKLLLGQIAPVPLAALLYLGCGAMLLVVRAFSRDNGGSIRREAPLAHRDYGWLAGSVLAGGVLAPIILLFSLRSTPAAIASLLLNFETVATALVALVVFGEALSKRAWIGMGLITAGGILLTLDQEGGWGLSLGALGIIAACALWGLDNNLTRNISAKDPRAIAMIKGLAAGLVSAGLALTVRSQLPPLRSAFLALLLGALSYGVSLVLFIRAMRGLGAARTSAMFGTAPLAGVIFSYLIFRGAPTPSFMLALALMVFGTLVVIREQHRHAHVHEVLIHEHAHSHEDAHHNHEHTGSVAGTHSHAHEHEKLEHEHQHMPDLHHRHTH